MQTISGSIPDKIAYVYDDKKYNYPVGSKWDIHYFERKFISDKMISGCQTNVCNNNPAEIKKNRFGSYQSIIIDNKPIQGIQILQYHPGQDTCSVIHNGYRFDISVSSIMESILNDGIKPGGVLLGEFIWGKENNEKNFNLIRIGSKLHKSILSYENKKSMKPIKKKELEVGRLYGNLTNKRAIFLGYIDSATFGATNQYFSYNAKPYKKGMLFFDIPYDLDQNRLIKEMLEPQHILKYHVLKKGHKFIEKFDQINLNSNIIEEAKAVANNFIKGQIINFSKNKIYNSTLNWNIIMYSDLLNMKSFNKNNIELFEVKKYLSFI